MTQSFYSGDRFSTSEMSYEFFYHFLQKMFSPESSILRGICFCALFFLSRYIRLMQQSRLFIPKTKVHGIFF